MCLMIGVALLGVCGAEAANAQSSVDCHYYAVNFAQYRSANGQVIRGGAGGALLGGAIGSFSGNFGRGAAIGAGVGLLAGGIRRGVSEHQLYEHAYRDCMAGRTSR
jgi:Glycine zipper